MAATVTLPQPSVQTWIHNPLLAWRLDLAAIRIGVLLGAVVILNAIDLLYTLFAYRIGMLNELNPFAQVFLQQGLAPSLICFKLLMSICGTGMLWKLRQSKWALPACWILLVAYVGLALVWYLWVRDVTYCLQENPWTMRAMSMQYP